MQIQGLKESELSEIPKEWKLEQLKENLSLLKDGTHNPPQRIKQGIPLLSAESIHNGIIDFQNGVTYITEKDYLDIHKRYEIQKDDILLTTVGTLGRVAKVENSDNRFSVQRSVAILRLKDRMMPDYFYYFLQSKYFQQQLYNNSKSTAQRGIYLTELGNITIFYPPNILEQQKIASILSNLDNLIQKTDQIIEQTMRLKKGLMQRLLTKGIAHTKFKKTELGEIPEDWDISKLENISLSFISGGTPTTSEKEYWNGDIPWTRSAVIKERYIMSGEKFISKLGLEKSASNIVPRDNLIIATRVSIGNFAINKIDIAINQDLTGILLDKKKMDTEFLYWMMFRLNETIKSFSQGSTIPGITKNSLKELKIAVPPLQEQQKISSILSLIDDLIKKQKHDKENIQNLKKGLMQQLLTGKIRVKA